MGAIKGGEKAMRYSNDEKKFPFFLFIIYIYSARAYTL
jgi:hypothetical protein